MGDPLVEVCDISKSFKGSFVLQGIKTSISRGQILGLVGPDGAGKTTLIRLMAGLLLPTSGSISIDGLDVIKDATILQRRIGYMPQKFGLYEDLTVLQNLKLYADLRSVVGEERKIRFEKLLHFTRLSPFLERLAGDLSGGMKQKLGLACALLSHPMLLLLDEPSVGVDPISRRELWTIVRELLAQGISIVWSTSYLNEAEACDRVLLLHEGKMLYDGDPALFAKRVEGRVFQISAIQNSRRQLLVQLFREQKIIDGVICGSDLRIVVKGDEPPVLNDVMIRPMPPRFEDAFVEVLGGSSHGISQLTVGNGHADEGFAIEANGLTKKFGSFTAAKEISFQIKPGEIFGLLGPNGAGKSTSFKMLCGLLKPTSGTAYVQGIDLQKAPGKGRARIGYMAQKFSLYGNLSVWQNLSFFSGIYNLKGKEKRLAIDEMVAIFNLSHYLNTNADELPLGFKQRLALACSIMHHPSVLFLDEPTSGVDPITRREFWSHIHQLVERGITVMVSTHFMDEAEYCDRVALIYRSRIISTGSPGSLRELVRSSLLPTPTLEDSFIHLIEAYDAQHCIGEN